VERPIGHILVVDDDPLNRRLLTGSLERQGHTTSTAEDGAKALDVLATSPTDVVLLDIVMPGLSGIDVLERMKQDPALRDIPVIMISGVDDAESIVRCIEAGAEDFLPKPFDPVILRARVNAGLSRKHVHDLERERVRHVFARFLPEPLVDEVLVKNEGEPTIDAELLTGTVLFADLRAFTTFAEGRPVEEVIRALNRHLSLITDAILDNGGTLVSYIGDGVLAAFGAPIPCEDHADRALRAARDMVADKMGRFNAWLRDAGLGDGFRLGVGINTGQIMSGSIGSSRRLDYTVIGDTVNAASRIEGLTKEAPYPILLSDETYASLRMAPPEDVVFVDEFEIRGRRSRIKLWGMQPRPRGALSVDSEVLRRLSEGMGGDPEFVAELVEQFIAESPDLISAARSGLASADVEEVRRAAHTLKSNAATFGAHELAERSRRLEEDAKTGTVPDGVDQIDAIAGELARVHEALPVAVAGLAEHP
jgi:adenylate cyclase